jgi:hypothetical protein
MAKGTPISALLWYHLYCQNGEVKVDVNLEVSTKVHSQIHRQVRTQVDNCYVPLKIQLEDEIERLL